MKSNQPPIYIIGAGAVGDLFASHFQKSGADCTMITRSPTSTGMLTLHIQPASDTADYREHDTQKIKSIDWNSITKLPDHSQIWVTTKATQLGPVIAELAKKLSQHHQIIFAQNGIGILNEVQDHFKKINFQMPDTLEIGRAVCWFGVRKETMSPTEHKLHVAGIDSVEFFMPKDASSVFDLLKRSQFNPLELKNVNDVEWRKGLWNVSMNALCALTNRENGAAALDPSLRPIAEQLMEEATAVAQAEGVAVTPELRERCFQGIIKTGANYNSTLMDLRHSRPTEMPWLNGAVVRLAKLHQLPCPTHFALNQMIQAYSKQ
jgi:2-dehydropantoate 2-reductase